MGRDGDGGGDGKESDSGGGDDGLGGSNPLLSASPLVEDPACEPPEVFCGLGSLIVEGRVPIQGSERGFGEGPHVPLAATKSRHECSVERQMVCW